MPLQASVRAPTFGLPASGDQKSVTSHKPRSRGILHSLFCCVCRDDAEAVPAHSGAPLLVEENGAVPKVCGGQVRAAGALGSAWRFRGKGSQDPPAGLGMYGKGWVEPAFQALHLPSQAFPALKTF